MPLSTVRLVNAVFYAHHGVMQEEHRIGGRYEVDVAMDFDFEEAAREDDLTKTVDYERVYRLVQELVTNNRFYLIERLAYLMGFETRRAFEDMLLGNAPILVERESGRLFETGTAQSTEYYIAQYERGQPEDLGPVDPTEYL